MATTPPPLNIPGLPPRTPQQLGWDILGPPGQQGPPVINPAPAPPTPFGFPVLPGLPRGPPRGVPAAAPPRGPPAAPPPLVFPPPAAALVGPPAAPPPLVFPPPAAALVGPPPRGPPGPFGFPVAVGPGVGFPGAVGPAAVPPAAVGPAVVAPAAVPPAAVPPAAVPPEANANNFAPLTYAEAQALEWVGGPPNFFTQTDQFIADNIELQFPAMRPFAGYWRFLEAVGPVNDRHFIHPGLMRITYGIELEFLSSSNRYVISSRANSCMLRQNNDFWRLNINYQTGLPQEPGKVITNDYNNFDQWSSYFIQDSDDHGSVSFKGDVICPNIGSAGLRTEDDPSVNFRINEPTQVWSSKARVNYNNTDLTDNGFQIMNAIKPAGQQFISRTENHNNSYSNERILDGNYGNNIQNMISINNETVTQILSNGFLEYPLVNRNFKNNAAANYQVGLLPFGYAVIDNYINHITSHGSVLFTQPGHGFHLHICEDRRTPAGQPAWSIDSQQRKNMLIGFVKLFYIFEPFLFSLFPSYRSSSGWCRSYQSIFTFGEIRYSTVNDIWDVLTNTGNNNIITNRTGNPYRYIALNFANCRIGGIGTIELRIGHSTFDSEFIQAYINLIQNLFNFNLYLNSLNPPGNPCGMQNIYMDIACRWGCFPSYVFQTSAAYDVGNANPNFFVNAVNPGRPAAGFFQSLQGQDERTFVISRQILLLVSLLNNISCMYILIQNINYYHSNQGNASRFKTNTNLNIITLANMVVTASQLAPANLPQMFANIPLYRNNKNIFYSIKMFTNYLPNVNKFDLEDDCRNCIKNNVGDCYINKYNNGISPILGAQRNGDPAQKRDQSRLYYRNCNAFNYYVKSQPELLFKKILPGYQNITYGGKNKTRKNKTRKNKNKTNKNKTNKNKINKNKTRKIKKLKSFGGTIENETTLNKMDTTSKYDEKAYKNTEIFEYPEPDNSLQFSFKVKQNSNQEPIKTKTETKTETVKQPNINDNIRYQINGEANKIWFSFDKDNNLLVGEKLYGVDNLIKDENLTDIYNKLVLEKILDKNNLEILSKNNLMEPLIYRNDLFKSELEKMFTENKLDKEKVSQMSNIIKKHYKNEKIVPSKLFSGEEKK
jgi:hypothetical protein